MANGASAGDVIVADNDCIIRDILRSLLEREGFSVLLGHNGLEAIDLASRTPARLVILDYKMPKLDGFAATAQIRRLPGYADVPIVILTAFNDSTTHAVAKKVGATAFLAKPFTSVDLLRGIVPLLDTGSVDRTTPSVHVEPSMYVWRRRSDPPPLYGEPAALAEGRRLLTICRR
jgi:CheY-like chemotaxis protein